MAIKRKERSIMKCNTCGSICVGNYHPSGMCKLCRDDEPKIEIKCKDGDKFKMQVNAEIIEISINKKTAKVLINNMCQIEMTTSEIDKLISETKE